MLRASANWQMDSRTDMTDYNTPNARASATLFKIKFHEDGSMYDNTTFLCTKLMKVHSVAISK